VIPAVTRPLRWDAATRTLWQAQVPGRPALKQLLGATGPALAERMGRATASLAVAALQPRTTFGRADQMQDTIKQGSELCRRVPWLAGAIRRLWAEVEKLHAAAPERPLVPIHGAPHPHQWLDDGVRLGLVDFDGFTRGDPELDIATFWSEIDFEKPHKMAYAAVNQAFLAGYEAIAGPVDRRLLAAYCAHKRLSKALKYAYALRSDADIRAEQALGRALMCVL
jgi:thiamine kinase-like enzyme